MARSARDVYKDDSFWQKLFAGVMGFFTGNTVWHNHNRPTGSSGSSVDSSTSDWDSDVSDAESVFGSIFGTGLSNEQRAYLRFSHYESDLARQWDEEMYNKYNSPSALMAQYRDAGLNPALMYGQQVSGNMNTSATPASASTVNSGPSFGDLLQMAGLKSEIDVNKARADDIRQGIEESKSRVDKLNAEVNQIGQNIVESKARVDNLNADTSNKRIVNGYLDEQNQAQIRLANASADEKEQMVQESLARIDNLDKQNQEILSNIAVNKARIRELLSQSDLNDASIKEVSALIEKVNAETKQIEENTNVTRKDIDYYEWNHAHKLSISGDAGVSVPGGVKIKGGGSFDRYDYPNGTRSYYKD